MPTFVEYSGKKMRSDVDDGKEIVWGSERDGWDHLYLYDGVTGKVKNQITKGNWVVRGLDRVDEANRQIYFRASGMYPGKDPYLVHYYRINFDGSGLTALTDADGNHTVSWSQDRKYYVDTWSRVDQPPVSQLRRTARSQGADGPGARRYRSAHRPPDGARRKSSPPWRATARPKSGASSSARPTSIRRRSIR